MDAGVSKWGRKEWRIHKASEKKPKPTGTKRTQDKKLNYKPLECIEMSVTDHHTRKIENGHTYQASRRSD
jgi:hypothetical protein